jgi:hypothetical protein
MLDRVSPHGYRHLRQYRRPQASPSRPSHPSRADPPSPPRIEQLPTPTYTPRRTIASAEQRLVFKNAVLGDEMSFIIGQFGALSALACMNTPFSTTSYSATRSTYSTVDAEGVLYGHEMALHSTAIAGMWTLCYKTAGGVWTMIKPAATHDLNVLSKPTFVPLMGMAGVSIPFTFPTGMSPALTQAMNDTNLVTVPIDGDYVTMQLTSCLDAYGTALGPNALSKRNLTALSAATDLAMTSPNLLKVCYATKESGGDSIGDFGTLDVEFRQLLIAPERTVLGSTQKVTIIGGKAGDKLSFDKEVNAAGNISCLGTSEGQSETETKTVTTACH